MLAKCFLLLAFISAYQCNDDGPQVTTPLGKIRGNTKISYGGRPFSLFEGIPFAKPPVGSRRFEEPEPIEPWDGIWDAKFATECPQANIFQINLTSGNEDCLHINVYVPRKLPDPSEKLDVIVHVHGGAYMVGSGHMYCRPEFIMDRDVIFVSFNYRVGIFGFLSTEDNVVPGNNGLKDQVLALKWVQENIASFGGNPNSVTLTGGSAGGSSVHLHYFSPLSKGLFHRGFSQSGVALNSFSIQEEPLNKAKLLANSVGCPTSPNQAMVRCLKQRPYEQLLDKVSLFLEYSFLPIAPFAPVIEKGQKPFLNADPYYLLSQGKLHDIPWLASNTIHEGLFPVMFFKDGLETFNERWNDLAPFLLDYNYTLPRTLWKAAAEKIKEFYLGDGEINKDNYLKFVQIFSDRVFLVDAENAIRMQAKVTESPVFYYLFSYPGDNNKEKTVYHGADGIYYFGRGFPEPGPLTSNELKMKDVMLDMLVSYAKIGKPTISGVTWEPTKSDELTYLNIDGFEPENINLRRTKELTPRTFWESLGFLEGANLISVKDEL